MTKKKRILVDGQNRHSYSCDEICNKEHDHTRRNQDIYDCNRDETCDGDHGLERRDRVLHYCGFHKMSDENNYKPEARDQDQDQCGCGHDETCDDDPSKPETRDQDQHGFDIIKIAVICHNHQGSVTQGRSI